MSLSSYVRVAGRYKLGEVIAMGGFGEVWRATDTILARPVAVKLLLTDHVQHPQALARFRTEAQRAGSLTHENIARVYDYLEPEPPDPPFLVMELVDGPSVAQLMSDGALSAAWAMHIVAGAAAGLEAAHRAGVVHRDIKPANLLLTRDRRVKVTDFGISYAVNSAPVTSTGQILGTPGYIAPERLNGTGVTTAADLYALGVVAYECLTGAAPFTGTPIEVVVAHRDQPLPPLPATVPPGVAALIMDMAAKDPAARPGSAGEVAARAAQLRDDLSPAPRAVPARPAKAGAVAPRPRHDGQPAQRADAEGLPAPAARLEPEAVLVPAPGLEPGWEAEAVPRPVPGAPGLEPTPVARPAPKSPAHSTRGVRWAALAGAIAIVLAVIGLIVARSGTGSPTHTAAAPANRAAPGVSTVQMIEVNAASLLGRPVTPAARQLRQLGLPVRIVWQRSRQSPGTVLAVQPSGQVAPHTVVTLTAAGQPGGSSGSSGQPGGLSGSSGQPGAVTVDQPSPGARPGRIPAGNPAPAAGGASAPASPPASGNGTGNSPTPSASASPSPGSDGNGNGNGGGGGGGGGKAKKYG